MIFVDRLAPRISREYERFTIAREMKRHLDEEIRACIDSGALPAATNPMVAVRLLTAGVLGVAVMRLSERLAPGENADQLAADVLSVALAGLQSGVALESTGAIDCPLAATPDEKIA